MYDNQFVSSARGEALSRLGEELGLPRPFLQAQGTIRLTPTLPDGLAELLIPRGARLFTAGNHHVGTTESVILTRAGGPKDVAVEAFYPGPEHNLDPNVSRGRPQSAEDCLLEPRRSQARRVEEGRRRPRRWKAWSGSRTPAR